MAHVPRSTSTHQFRPLLSTSRPPIESMPLDGRVRCVERDLVVPPKPLKESPCVVRRNGARAVDDLGDPAPADDAFEKLHVSRVEREYQIVMLMAAVQHYCGCTRGEPFLNDPRRRQSD